MIRVVILQEYVPQYRVPFFELLRELGLESGIDIRVAHGEAGTSLAKRDDASNLSFALPIQQIEKRIAGRRVVVRRIGHAIDAADLIILEQARRNLDAYRLLAFRRQKGPIVALWGHGKDFTRPTTLLERRLSRWLTSKADWFFAYTIAGMNHVVSQGFPHESTTVVQNSMDSLTLRESVASITAVERESFAKIHDLRGKTALFIGGLDESKRLPFLRDAAVRLYAQESDFRLLVAGSGAIRGQVEEWAKDFSWIRYLGPLSGHDKAIAMASAEVLSMPGRVGLVAVDSFAAGIPIVTTDWNWHAPEFDYLEDGLNAIVTRNSSVAYTNGLLSVLRNPILRQELQTAALASSHIYSVEAMASNFISGVRAALALRNL